MVSEREGEIDEEIQFTYNRNERIRQYNLQYYRYVQYVRIKTYQSTQWTTGMVLDEVEVYAFSEYILSHYKHLSEVCAGPEVNSKSTGGGT